MGDVDWSTDFSPSHSVCKFWHGVTSRAECTCGWEEYGNVAELFEGWKDHVVESQFGRVPGTRQLYVGYGEVSPAHPSVYGILNRAIYGNDAV